MTPKLHCKCGVAHQSQRTYDDCLSNQTGKRKAGGSPRAGDRYTNVGKRPATRVGVTVDRGGQIGDAVDAQDTRIGSDATVHGKNTAISKSSIQGEVTVQTGDYVGLTTGMNAEGSFREANVHNVTATGGKFRVGGEGTSVQMTTCNLTGRVIVTGNNVRLTEATLYAAGPGERVTVEGDHIRVRQSTIVGNVQVEERSSVVGTSIYSASPLRMGPGTHIRDGAISSPQQVTTLYYTPSERKGDGHKSVTVYPTKNGPVVAGFHSLSDGGTRVMSSAGIRRIQASDRTKPVRDRNPAFAGYDDAKLDRVISEIERIEQVRPSPPPLTI